MLMARHAGASPARPPRMQMRMAEEMAVRSVKGGKIRSGYSANAEIVLAKASHAGASPARPPRMQMRMAEEMAVQKSTWKWECR